MKKVRKHRTQFKEIVKLPKSLKTNFYEMQKLYASNYKSNYMNKRAPLTFKRTVTTKSYNPSSRVLRNLNGIHNKFYYDKRSVLTSKRQAVERLSSLIARKSNRRTVNSKGSLNRSFGIF